MYIVRIFKVLFEQGDDDDDDDDDDKTWFRLGGPFTTKTDIQKSPVSINYSLYAYK